jgi:phage protein D
MSESFTSVNLYAPGFVVKIAGQDEISSYVSKVVITKALTQADQFSIEVKDYQENGQFKWLGSDTLKVGNQVSIELGYTGNLDQKVEALILNINTKYETNVTASITLEGVDKVYRLLTARSESETYQKKKDNEIVSAIASEVGLQADVDTTGITFEEKKKKGDISYLEFIKILASRNAGFEFMITEGKLLFRKAKINEDGVVTLSNDKEIFSFKPTLNTSELVSEVEVRTCDQKNKEVIIGKAPAGSEFKQEGNKQLASEVAKEVYGAVKKVISDLPVDTKEEADEIALAALVESGNKLIKVEVECIGIPEITPGVCVEIEGTGDLYDGKYYVEKAVHNMDVDKYRTTFNARRNAL